MGVVRRDETAKQAIRMRALDMATLNLKAGVQDADLVILAGPISTIVSQLKCLSGYLSPKAIVMDVGSSKGGINAVAGRFLKKNIFVGCHPMAGSEKCSIRYANPALFEGSICFVTQRNAKVRSFWRALGSRPIFIKDHDHDAWVARSSHLPHLIAFALFRGMDAKYPMNPSLKDLSRLASSHSALWADIFLSNRRQVMAASAEFQKNISKLQKALRLKNRNALIRFIEYAHKQTS